MLLEQRFRCPYCGEDISMVLDLTVADQNYVEDCEVCCRSIEIAFQCDRGGLREFRASRSDE